MQDSDLNSNKDRSDKEMKQLISWLNDEIDKCTGYGLPRQHLENIVKAFDDVIAVHNQRVK